MRELSATHFSCTTYARKADVVAVEARRATANLASPTVATSQVEPRPHKKHLVGRSLPGLPQMAGQMSRLESLLQHGLPCKEPQAQILLSPL